MDLQSLEDGPAGIPGNLVRANVQLCTWEGGIPATMQDERDWLGSSFTGKNLGALTEQQTECEPALCCGREGGQQHLGLYEKEQSKQIEGS